MLSSLTPFHPGSLGRLLGGGEPNAATLGQESGRALARGTGIAAPGKASALAPVEQGHGASSFDKVAKKLVNRALDSLGRDLGKLFKGFGDLGGTVKDLLATALEPIRDALAQGQDFTAEIKIAAARRQTVVTQGGYAESLDLVAKSLTIEVNHDTGEVSLDLKSLSIRQSTAVSFAGQGVDLAAFPQASDGAGAGDYGLGDFVKKLLEEVRPHGTEDEKRPEAAPIGTAAPDLAPAAEQILPAVVEAKDAAQKPQAPRDSDEDRPARIAWRGAERFRNDIGQLVTRLRLDVAVRVASETELQDLAKSLSGDGNRVGFDLHA